MELYIGFGAAIAIAVLSLIMVVSAGLAMVCWGTDAAYYWDWIILLYVFSILMGTSTGYIYWFLNIRTVI